MVSQVERGTVSTRIETLEAIADAFSLDPEIFLRKDGYLEVTGGRTLHQSTGLKTDREILRHCAAGTGKQGYLERGEQKVGVAESQRN